MNTSGTERLGDGSHDGTDSNTHCPTTLSRPLTAVALASLAAGLVSGGVLLLQRDPERADHVDGTAAWWPHAVLALITVAGLVLLRRRGVDLARSALAPIGTSAARRLAATVRSVPHHPTAALRLLGGLVPLAILVFGPFRTGQQVLAGLDPNFTVNAWGGPSYVGAMACHYLDGALMMALAAWLLHLLLLRSHDIDSYSSTE
ncbi:hypothetical protein [Nocardia callitridis]|uniref:Cytochrome b561 bacterial/Ni-hydrogenase domain-containing protein n=1 Tax=Nocardia callitridis TaxID=648753 RepID=A0ABP9K5W3_9NOCA